MKSESDWGEEMTRLLQGELKKRGVNYAELAKRLTEMGIPMTETAIKGQVYRKAFKATFMAQCFRAIGATQIDLSHL